jgi:hypothetical protein
MYKGEVSKSKEACYVPVYLLTSAIIFFKILRSLWGRHRKIVKSSREKIVAFV